MASLWNREAIFLSIEIDEACKTLCSIYKLIFSIFKWFCSVGFFDKNH